MFVLIEQGTNKPVEVCGHQLFDTFGFMWKRVPRAPWRFVLKSVKSVYRIHLHLVTENRDCNSVCFTLVLHLIQFILNTFTATYANVSHQLPQIRPLTIVHVSVPSKTNAFFIVILLLVHVICFI